MLQKIKSWFGISTLENNQIQTLSDRDKEEKKGIRYRVKSKPVAVTLGMKEFKQALELAKKFDKPKWNALIDQYETALFDCHLSAQIYNRKQKVLKQKFAIFENDKINDEKTKLVQKPFFYDFIDLSLDALFFGNSLVEFSTMNEQGEFTEVNIIPRQHVCPSDGVIYFNLSDQKGYDYRDKKVKENNFLFEVNNGDFGLLAKATPQAIRKTYSLEDWSIKCEKFGQPFIALFTDEQDKELLDEYQNMLANVGANGYGIFGSKDRNMIEYIEANSGQGAYQTFSELIKFCNEEMSKLIAGGTGTTDEKAFVGTAELHERMLNDIVDADMRYTESLITYNLIPFLVSHGYPLEGCEFRFVMPEKKEEKKHNATENKKDKQDLSLSSVKKSFGTMLLPTNSDVCCTLNDDDNLEFDINLGSFVKQIFEGKLKKGEISKPVFRIYNEILQAAITEGYENVPDSDKAFFNELSYNQSVFAAFKTHSIADKLVEQLKNENGELRTFSEFQKAVNPFLDNYNQNWLRAEYNTSVASAQAAKKWQEIERDVDLFPFLEFRTMGDNAVRGEHQRLNGIIRRVEDDFWNTHYPPLGFNCRCTVRKLEEGTETKLAKDLPQPSKGFEENVGKSARIFDTEKHSYANGTSENKIRKGLEKLGIVKEKLPTEGTPLKNYANFFVPKDDPMREDFEKWITEVNKVFPTKDLPTMKLYSVDTIDKENPLGIFIPNKKDFDAIIIRRGNVNPLTLFHEIAHAYDFNKGKESYFSETPKGKSFLNIVLGTKHYNELLIQRNYYAKTGDKKLENHFAYLMRDREIFARALSQYISLISKNQDALNFVIGSKVEQWTEKDFETLKKYFDESI